MKLVYVMNFKSIRSTFGRRCSVVAQMLVRPGFGTVLWVVNGFLDSSSGVKENMCAMFWSLITKVQYSTV